MNRCLGRGATPRRCWQGRTLPRAVVTSLVRAAGQTAVRGHHSAQAKPGELDVVVLDTECLGHALRDPGHDEPALSLNDGVLQNIHHEDMFAHAAVSLVDLAESRASADAA